LSRQGLGQFLAGQLAVLATLSVVIYQEQGALNREIAVNAAHRAGECAVEGAVIGGATGAVGVVVAPVLAPAIGSALTVVDDVARPVIQAVDDVAGPVAKQVSKNAHATMMSIEKAGTSALKSIKKGLPTAVQRILPKTTRSTGYVYVMDDAGSGAQKIGLSIDPKRRLGEIKSPSGTKPKIVCTIPTYNMKALEDSLHAAFATQNLPNTGAGREWFNLSSSQVKAICN
jgi:hypothetical protein